MDILNSDWLLHTLKKAGKTPQARLLSLFDILDDWTEAPGVISSIELTKANHSGLLQNYLAIEAAKAGAAVPEMLASQLYFMALSAMQEKLKDKNNEGMRHAKSAALALITAQTKKEFHIAKSSAYAIAASFAAGLVVAGSLFITHQNNAAGARQIAALEPLSQPLTETQLTANPKDTAALIAEINQMRKGNCQLIEALQLPDSYKKVYFENIVLGQISTNQSDQKLVREILQKVRCNYTPMLMANSTS
jgi:hypothetical protein